MTSPDEDISRRLTTIETHLGTAALPQIDQLSKQTPTTVVLQPWPGIGDMIWHIPVLRTLAARDPSGRIDLIAREKIPVRTLLGNQNIVARHLPLPMGRGLAGRLSSMRMFVHMLRGGGYEQIFIFHDSLRYALSARLARIPELYGYGFGAQRLLLTQKKTVPSGPHDRFPLKRANAVLEIAGLAARLESPHVIPDAAAMDAVVKAYAAYPKPWVGFGIGSLGLNRIWPAERFAAVADALWEAGYRSLFLLGAPSEAAIARSIKAQCRTATPVAVTNGPLDQTIALIARCAFTLCNDSGLMNVSAALRVPVYVPFGVPFGATGSYDCSGDLRALFVPYLHAIMPEDGVDRVLGASKITTVQILDKLRADGILDPEVALEGQMCYQHLTTLN